MHWGSCFIRFYVCFDDLFNQRPWKGLVQWELDAPSAGFVRLEFWFELFGKGTEETYVVLKAAKPTRWP